MAWRRPGDKPLSEPMMVILLTHICVTRPQWVNGESPVPRLAMALTLMLIYCQFDHHEYASVKFERLKDNINLSFQQNIFTMSSAKLCPFCSYRNMLIAKYSRSMFVEGHQYQQYFPLASSFRQRDCHLSTNYCNSRLYNSSYFRTRPNLPPTTILPLCPFHHNGNL